MAPVVVGAPLDLPGRIGSSGWLRSRAWIWAFSSTHSTSALSGGFRYSPTMSRTLSMNNGSGDSLKVSLRCGCRLKARQIRLTVLWLMPHCRAIARVLQCVASRGVVSRVNVTTRSTSASLTVRGAPGRGSSSNPSSRFATKRLRHLPRSAWSRAARAPPRCSSSRPRIPGSGARAGRRLRRRRTAGPVLQRRAFVALNITAGSVDRSAHRRSPFYSENAWDRQSVPRTSDSGH